ncbi:MAG TPA: tetratricopeptide repeat protein [Pseudomonadota bacterium]|nr:tetratricopeptide repeat protein [Pseudomonadota bacterium]
MRMVSITRSRGSEGDWRRRLRGLIALMGVSLLGVPSLSLAMPYTHTSFYGWSPDGSYYVTTWQGTDLFEHPQVCLSDKTTGSASWPKPVRKPTGDRICSDYCAGKDRPDDEPSSCDSKRITRAVSWVRLPLPAKRGTSLETLQLKWTQDSAEISVMAGTNKLASRVLKVELEKGDTKPTLQEAYWRPGGGAVAVYLGYPDRPTTQDDESEGGYPGPRFLTVLSWAAPRADLKPLNLRDQAESANVRGMRYYRVKRYAEAAKEFRDAIGADSSLMIAHYNLACMAALLKDSATAVAQLRWLAQSNDPQAAAKLAKAHQDADLKSVMGLQEVRKLLKGVDPKDVCEGKCLKAQDRCSNACPDDEAVRSCVMLCNNEYETCIQKCGNKPE